MPRSSLAVIVLLCGWLCACATQPCEPGKRCEDFGSIMSGAAGWGWLGGGWW